MVDETFDTALRAEEVTAEDPFTPKPIKLSLEKEQELVNTVSKNYNNTKSAAWFTKMIKNLGDWHEAYLGVMPETSFPWTDASNVDLGIIEMCVDNIKSRYKLSTLGAKPMFNAIPVTEAGEDKKEKITDGMNLILDKDIRIADVADDICQNTVEYGTCPTKLLWQRDLVETKEYGNLDGIIFPKDKTETEEKGQVERIELEDLIVPQNCPDDVMKAPWIYHRLWYSVYDLGKKVELKVFPEGKVEEIKAALTIQKEQGTKTAEEKAKAYRELPEEKVEVLECYMRFDADNDGLEEECIFWVCPVTNTYVKGFYLKDIYFNGQRPFYIYRYKKTGSFYGRGVVEMLLPYRKLMNELFNYAVNCLMLQILPWGFYRIGSSFKPEEVRLSPGTMIPVDDINDVKMAQFASNSATVMDGVVMLIMSFVERQTGISSPHMGKEFPTRKTATEVRTIISEGNVKHEDRIQVFQNIFSDMLKGVYNLYKQNNNKGRKGRIGDGEDYRFVELFSAFDQMPDYDFIILGTLTTGNKVIEREDTMALYSITSQNPIMAEWPIGQLELLKEVFTTYGKRNIKRFLPPDQLIQMFTQAKLGALQQQMQAMQAGQQDAPAGASPAMETKAEGESMPEAGLPVSPAMPGGGGGEL